MIPTPKRITIHILIRHKSTDLASAREVYDALAAAGYRVFLSEVSIEKCGTSECQKVIGSALESSRHLFVVCSPEGNLQSPWVEAE